MVGWSLDWPTSSYSVAMVMSIMPEELATMLALPSTRRRLQTTITAAKTRALCLIWSCNNLLQLHVV
jgi:hypothetical protein